MGRRRVERFYGTDELRRIGAQKVEFQTRDGIRHFYFHKDGRDEYYFIIDRDGRGYRQAKKTDKLKAIREGRSLGEDNLGGEYRPGEFWRRHKR